MWRQCTVLVAALLAMLTAVQGQGQWSTIANKALSCTDAEYKGDLGAQSSAAACLGRGRGDVGEM